MYARRPACHVEPDLTDDLQGRQRINTINLRQVAPSHRVEILMDVKARRLPLGIALACEDGAQGRVSDLHFTSMCAMLLTASEGEHHGTHAHTGRISDVHFTILHVMLIPSSEGE